MKTYLCVEYSEEFLIDAKNLEEAKKIADQNGGMVIEEIGDKIDPKDEKNDKNEKIRVKKTN